MRQYTNRGQAELNCWPSQTDQTVQSLYPTKLSSGLSAGPLEDNMYPQHALQPKASLGIQRGSDFYHL